jgi:hypothetical protein
MYVCNAKKQLIKGVHAMQAAIISGNLSLFST